METTNGKVKLIGLQADGFRKLTAVEMEFKDKGLIPIYGKNKQGKTSLIDFIRWMIEGNKRLNPDIIQHGAEKINGKLTLGDYELKRVVTKKTPRFEVRNIATNTVEKGEIQNFIDTFVNELTFNPRPFLDKTPHQQLKFVMDLFKIDFTELDKQLETLEQDRLICGREVKKFGDLDTDRPEKVERVDVQKLLAERKKIEEKNASNRAEYDKAKNAELEEIEKFNKEQREKASAIRQKEDAIKICTQHIDEHKIKIEELEKQLQQLKAKLHQHQENYKELVNEKGQLLPPQPEKPLLTSLPAFEPLSTDDIDKQIQEANAFNVKADAYERWQEKKKEKKQKEDEYKAYDSKINGIREKKLEILRSVDTGVKGLEIREDGLYYNGNYSQNWSDAEGIRISAELCIAQLPKLKAIFIDRGESFDEDSLKALEEWAKENDIQAFITIVKNSVPEDAGESCFYIEEGRLVEQ